MKGQHASAECPRPSCVPAPLSSASTAVRELLTRLSRVRVLRLALGAARVIVA